MNKKIELSIIIVSFNTARLLKDCLESVQDSIEDINCEVIVVDNGSKDDSLGIIEEYRSKLDLKLIKNNKNRGFGAANNQGMNIAKGKNILLLNSDTIVNKTAINESVSYIKSQDEVGVLGCKLVEEDGTIQSNGGYFPNMINVFFWMTLLDDIRFLYKMIKPYHIEQRFEKESVREQDWVTGAFFMLKKSIFDELGGFDEDYFMYVEEMDYCFRIKSKDYKVIYNPDIEIIHLGGGSGSSENALISEFEGLLKFFEKHKNGKFFIQMLIKLGSLIRMILFKLMGKDDLANTYVKAFKTI